MPLGRFWAVATFCLPVCSPWSGSPPPTCCVPRVWSSNSQRKPTWNLTKLTFGAPWQLQQVHHQIVTFVFCSLLLFPGLFLSLLIFVVFSCRLLFLSSLSSFLPVAARFGRLRDEHGTQHISKNKSRPFSWRCFGFSSFPTTDLEPE